MKTVYGVRLESPRWSAQDHRRARAIVDDWLEETHPFADRGPGVSVRVDDDDPDRWWRYSVGVGSGRGDVSSTVVSAGTSGTVTSFEIRLTFVPGDNRIRSQSPSVSAVEVMKLARSMVSACSFYDAGVRIGDSARTVSDVARAQEVAALCDAPSRSLPILIETIPAEGSAHAPAADPTSGEGVFRAERLALTLTGLAHIFRIRGEAARQAFNEFFGEGLLVTCGLSLVWPDRSRQTWSGSGLAIAGGDDVRRQCNALITSAAAESLGALRPPLFRRRPIEDQPSFVESKTSVEDDVEHPSTVPWDDYGAALDGWQESEERITELEEALAEADRMIAEKQQVLERGDELVDQLVLQNTRLAIRIGATPQGLVASNAADAVRQATHMCEHLTFHPRALESAERLDGIDANRLLQDLVRLDVVAGDWQSGRINDASLTISCRSIGLNYAGGISDTAEYKYGEDYAFTWRGRTEYAVAHIRNGKGSRLYRVHLYFDNETQQVVVAYIGRHLRGKRT